MLENLKQGVIRIAKDAQRLGLCKHKSGNFSLRDTESGLVLITPTGIDRELLSIDDIVVMDLELNILEGGKPSSETQMHIEIYKERNDVFGIAHTHSKMGTAFSVLNKSLPPIIYEVTAFNLKDGHIPVAPYARPGTIELAHNVAKTVKESDLVLMEKHGVIAVGKNIDEAFLHVQYIEEVAEVYYYTLMINQGKEPEYFDNKELSSWTYPEVFKR